MLAVDARLAVLGLTCYERIHDGDMEGVVSLQEGRSSGDTDERGRGFAIFPQPALLKRRLSQQETLRETMKARIGEAPAQLALKNQPQSALDLASGLNPTQPRLPAVDVSAWLSEANLSKTPQSGWPVVALFQKLQALLLLQTISRISEEARNGQAHRVALTVGYDEFRRRSWEARAACNDVTLDIDAEPCLVDRDTPVLARARLDQVLVAADLKRTMQAQTSSQPLASVAVLVRPIASAEVVTERAEQAIARLQSAKSLNSQNKGGKGGRRTERSRVFHENKQKHDDRMNDVSSSVRAVTAGATRAA